jgi:uncharacterized membrane protein
MNTREKYWYRFFEAGIVIKAINGAWEMASGFTLLVVSSASLNSAFLFVFRNELINDPHDYFIQILVDLFHHFTLQVKHIATFYLIAHGLMNIFIAYNLHLKRLRVYIFSIFFDFLLILYFFYLYSRNHSVMLIWFVIFNMIFILLTWHEYKERLSSAKVC